MKIVNLIIEIIYYLINVFDNKKKEDRYNQKKEQINESRKDPEGFFKNHFGSNDNDDDSRVFDDDENSESK